MNIYAYFLLHLYSNYKIYRITFVIHEKLFLLLQTE